MNTGLNIRHFKLMNGEEIIGLLAIKNDDNYIIERPVRINPSLLGGIQFSAWFPFSEDKQFKVLKSSIIQHVPIAESIKDTYVYKEILNSYLNLKNNSVIIVSISGGVDSNLALFVLKHINSLYKNKMIKIIQYLLSSM